MNEGPYGDGLYDAQGVVESDESIDLILALVEERTGVYDVELAQTIVHQIGAEIKAL